MKILSAITAVVLGISCSLLSAAELAEYTANYTASANGIKASATRSLSRGDNNLYQLENHLVAEFAGLELASLKENSTFLLAESVPVPQSYSYALQGLGREAKSIQFDWNAQVAVSVEGADKWTLPLQSQTQDPLSYQAALQLSLIESEVTAFSWPIVNGDKIEIQNFRIEGEETLETPVGSLECIRLVRIRDDASTSTTIWLAKNWAYLLTKIEQVNRSGVEIILELESAIVDGISVAN